MSEPTAPAPPARGGCLAAFMIGAGIVLLLPGVCSGFFMVGAIVSLFQSPTANFDSGLIGFWIIGFTVSAIGVAMIVAAARRLRR